MFSKPIYIVIFIFICSNIFAQQDPHYTQYMYNMSVVNPAYATDNPESLNVGALYRAQWVGIEGAPSTGMFFAHKPLSKNIELGVSFVHDQVGEVVKETTAFVDFAYVLRFGEKHKLSFGIKAGGNFFSTDFNGFQYTDVEPDQAFANNLSRVYPNIGTGIFYFTDTYYVGLSVPNMLQNTHLSRQDGVVANGVESNHYFLTAGYVFNLNENIKFKPAFMTKMVASSPASFDFTSNFLLYNKVEVGAAYRVNDAVSGLLNFRISEQIRIGYSYDYTLTNLTKFNSGSHEFMLLFDLGGNKNRKGFDKSPRFF
jgi:type IX secretion system PorP/SprF family membrane protein